MNKKLLSFSLILFSLLIFGLNNTASTVAFKNNEIVELNKSDRTPVLLELFTSESCFACPPAEMLLSKMENNQPFDNAELITLEFHVDYRDSFGRKDKLASPLFTQRQKFYDKKFRTGKIYTPQMVVDGGLQFAGSDYKKVEKAIDKTIKDDKANVNLSIKNERLSIKISNIPKNDYATVYLAIAEDGIITRDRKLIDEANVSIVRRLNALGRIKPDQKTFEMETYFQILKGWKKHNIKLIVFLQENGSRKILGVGKTKIEVTSENHKS